MKSFCLTSVLKLVLLFSIVDRLKAENEDERLIKEELVKYFQAVDSDEDHHLTMDELARWIRKIHNIVIDENVSAQWKNLDKEIVEEHTWVDYELARKETVTWESYKKRIYRDHLEDQKAMNNKRSKEEIENEFNQIVARFEKRWKLADEDGTGYVTKEEFKFYLHPEESKNETILNAAAEDLRDDLDRNNDGIVSFDEYFDHIKSISNEEERQEPDFEQINKENFEVHLDKNKNGILDLEEIKTWMMPDFEKYKMEAAHLLEQTDLNRDNELQLEELVDGYASFYNLLPPKFYTTLERGKEQRPPAKHDEF